MPDYYNTTWTDNTYATTATTNDYVIYLDDFVEQVNVGTDGTMYLKQFEEFKPAIRFQGNPMLLFAQRCVV